jgi:hypothetical protein
MIKYRAYKEVLSILEAIRVHTFRNGGEEKALCGTIWGLPWLSPAENLSRFCKFKNAMGKLFPSVILVVAKKHSGFHAHLVIWTGIDIAVGLPMEILRDMGRVRKLSKDPVEKSRITKEMIPFFRGNRDLMQARSIFRKEKEKLKLGKIWVLEPVLNIEAIAVYTAGNYMPAAAWRSKAPKEYCKARLVLMAGIPKGTKPKADMINAAGEEFRLHRLCLSLIADFFNVTRGDWDGLLQVVGWDQNAARFFARQLRSRLGGRARANEILSAGYARWEGYEILADLLMDASVFDSYGQQGAAAELVDHTRDRDADWIETNLVPVGHGGGAVRQAAEATVPPEGCQGIQMQGEAAA